MELTNGGGGSGRDGKTEEGELTEGGKELIRSRML